MRNALVFGMTAHDFMYSDPKLFGVYMSAYEERARVQDTNNHSLGLYFLLAGQQVMASAFSNRKIDIYPRRPFLDESRKAAESVDEKILRMITRHNASRGKDIYGNKI